VHKRPFNNKAEQEWYDNQQRRHTYPIQFHDHYITKSGTSGIDHAQYRSDDNAIISNDGDAATSQPISTKSPAALIAYLCGSMSYGPFLGRKMLKGIDIREHRSKSVPGPRSAHAAPN
jgi:hypothetical protein